MLSFSIWIRSALKGPSRTRTPSATEIASQPLHRPLWVHRYLHSKHMICGLYHCWTCFASGSFWRSSSPELILHCPLFQHEDSRCNKSWFMHLPPSLLFMACVYLITVLTFSLLFMIRQNVQKWEEAIKQQQAAATLHSFAIFNL